MKKLFYTLLSLLTVLVIVYILATDYDENQYYNNSDFDFEVEPKQPRVPEKYIRQVGTKKMVFYSGGINGGKAYNKASFHQGDDYTKVYFELVINTDGKARLLNIQYDQPDNWKLAESDIHTMIRLDAAVYFQSGKDMREKLQNTLNGKSRYSLEDGYEYGLKKYVEYFRKDNKRPAGQITHLVTMKDTKTPLRLLEVTSLTISGKPAGGVDHYFMYNDFVQVDIFYRKIYLKDWQRIENAVRNYVDKLYQEAKDE